MSADEVMKDIDHYTVLSAIWVFACNDERPLISYRGVRHRLSLPPTYPVETIVQDRAELFRLRAPNQQLEAYKVLLRSGPKGPSWLAAAKDPAEKLRLIDALQPTDFFRSQFRTEADAPRSSLEVLKWGLDHIERLRAKNVQKQDDRHKRVTAVWIPAGSLIATIAALIVSSCVQWNTAEKNADLQVFETTFQPRQQGYSTIMRSMWTSYQVAASGDRVRTDSALAALETALFEVEPVLAPLQRDSAWAKYRDFEAFCRKLAVQPSAIRVAAVSQFTSRREGMAQLLRTGMFESSLVRSAAD